MGVVIIRLYILKEDVSIIPISEISREVGITDTLYFSKKFRNYTGITPSEYRKSKL